MITTLKNMKNSKQLQPPIKNYLFHQRMMDFVNKLDFGDQKYQTDGNVSYGNYNGKFLLPMK